MINLTNITLSFGQRDLFRDISLRIDPHARIGLVGRNGAGKTTLLKIIIGQDKPSRGSVNISKDLRVGYMAQDVILKSDKTILNEALSADEHFWKVRTGMQEIEHAIASDTHNPELLEQYVQLQQEYQRLEPHVYEKEVQRVITGMGFAPALWNNPVDSLSVGWKMRLVLAKLLLQRADFYLFDEPTNHLDIIAREWFLRFLKEASFGFVIISHDKFFLNTLCKTIVELENGNGIVYDGNYDDYEVRKEADFEILSTRYKQQQKEIKHTQELIYKFRAKASKAKFAQSLIKQLDSMERIELPPSIKNIAIRLAEPKRSGQMVLTVEGLAYAFGDKQIFKDVSFIIQRGQRVAIIAPNGAGKTTLLNCITGKLTPQKGTVEFGHNVEWVLFDQDQTKALNLEKSIFDNIFESVSNVTEQMIRTMLGSFLFPGGDAHKKVKVLSGGEKNRVGIVKTLLVNANFLLLDEPTNHLDIISKDILKKSLKSFEGTMLFVSHDHDFVMDVADAILELTPEGAYLFPGNYEEFLFYKESLQSPDQSKTKSPAQALPQPSSEGAKKIKMLEREISKLEDKIEKAQAAFGDIEYGTPEFDQQCKKLKQFEVDLKALMVDWERLQK